MSGVATGPYVDRLIRIFRDRPSDDTSALVLIDFANASIAALTPPAAAPRVEETKCIHCGEPTMHVGNVCYACSHPGSENGVSILNNEGYGTTAYVATPAPTEDNATPAAPSVSPAVEGDAGELPELPKITRFDVVGDIAYPIHEAEFGSMVDYDDHAAAMRAYGEQCRRLATPEQPDTEGVPFCPRCGAHPDEQPGSAVQGEAVDGSLTYAEQRKVVEHMTTELGAAIGILQKVQQRAEAIDCQPLTTTPPPAPAAEQGEMSPEFTDSARAALAWVLYHHQGGSSPVGQPIRFALGMGEHEPMLHDQIDEAKCWAGLTGAKTCDFHATQPEVRGVEEWDRLSMLSLAEGLRKRGDDLSVDSASWLEKIATPNPVRAEQPEGKWKLVPVVPTDAMLFAMQRARYGYERGDDTGQWSALAYFDQSLRPHMKMPDAACGQEYRAMLAAAPAAPGAAVGVDEEAVRLLREIADEQTEEPRPGSLLARIDAYLAALAGKAQEESNV